jgi:hypothetical protein
VIRIPLERLLDRLAGEVAAAALQAGGDPYARAQLEAAAEILRNLAPRVQWREDAALEARVAELLSAGDAVDREALRSVAAAQLEQELARLRR